MGFRSRHHLTDLGVGVGFRAPHAETIFASWPSMDWFEILSDNYLVDGGRPLEHLDALRARYPVVPHGVSLSVGGTDPFDASYVSRLATLFRRIEPRWFSDHLCFVGVGGTVVHDLLPLPHTREAIDHVVERIRRVQGTFERPFVVENVSSYVTYPSSAMPEWEFLATIAERADCGILFDCNNVYVSSRNHGFDADAYVDAMPADRIVQIHLAGHTDKGTHLLDTHSDHVKDDVWRLYERTIRRTGPVSTLVEWDEDIPSWDVLAAEAAKARTVRERVLVPEVRATLP